VEVRLKKSRSKELSEMTAESSESVDPLSVEGDGVIRDVAFVRFTMNGKVDALDVLRRPIHELCGHSMAKWDAIQERLTADAKLVLMSHGQERPIEADIVSTIQRWT
jgi:hypothetical protein